MKNKPIIILGAGGHAKVLLDMLLNQKVKIIGILDTSPRVIDNLYDIPIIGTDNDIVKFDPNEIELVNGIGSIGVVNVRCEVYKKFKSQGYHFRQVIHNQSIISSRVKLGEGIQVMAGAIVNAGSCIEENAIINTRTSVDHDCHIGSHVHIAHGSSLSGNVNIGSATLIGAGSAVINDIPNNVKAYGVPARVIKKG